MDMRHGYVRGGLRAGAISALLALLVGCGSSTKHTGAQLGPPVLVRSATVKSTDGKSAKVVVSVYRRARASKIPTLPYTGRNKTYCRVNPAKDVAIPIGVKVVNTTPKARPPLDFSLALDQPAAVRAAGSAYARNVDMIQADIVYPGGSSGCVAGDEDYLHRYFVLEQREAPKTGDELTYDFFLVGHRYYSRKHPRGDPMYWRGFKLVPHLVFGLELDRRSGTLSRTTPIAPITVAAS
jgi:hypothetical protein